MGIFNLPEGYSEIKKVDMQKDKKLAVLINMTALGIMTALFFIGFALVPFSYVAESGDLLSFGLKAFGTLLAIILYMFAHELVHGVFIKKYSGKKAKYGFTGLYAFAGSDAYFTKREYIVIALSPVVLFGILFLLLNILLPAEWFWAIYLLQVANLSGAAGDAYITVLVRGLPADMLVKDEGVCMEIYSRKA